MVIFAVFSYILYIFLKVIVDHYFYKRIRQAKDIFSEIKIRKQAAWCSRHYVMLVSLCVIVAATFWYLFEKPQITEIINSIVGYAIFIVLVFILNDGADIVSEYSNERFSFITKDDFINKYSHYALYLRGFFTDDRTVKSIEQKEYIKFSEYQLVKALEKEFDAFGTIGMTKELNSPHGAMRIYLDDETWSEDVYLLMEKSEKVFILMNDSNSCIWEIRNATPFIDKTVFIIDDLEKYDNICRAIPEFSFPCLEETKRNLKEKGQYWKNTLFILTKQKDKPWSISYMQNYPDYYIEFKYYL